MSVNVDRVLGWTVDLSDIPYEKLSGILYEEEFKEELERTHYVDDYGRYNKGDIKILYDGMSGDYSYLVWVIYGEDCDDFEDGEFYDNLNVMLEELHPTEDVISDMREVLEVIGYEDLVQDIQLKAIRHYH